MSVDITLIDKICGNCKETSLFSLKEEQSISIFLNGKLIIKKIYDNYITLCVQTDTNLYIIRNCSLSESIPICLNCQSLKIKVTKITQ